MSDLDHLRGQGWCPDQAQNEQGMRLLLRVEVSAQRGLTGTGTAGLDSGCSPRGLSAWAPAPLRPQVLGHVASRLSHKCLQREKGTPLVSEAVLSSEAGREGPCASCFFWRLVAPGSPRGAACAWPPGLSLWALQGPLSLALGPTWDMQDDLLSGPLIASDETLFPHQGDMGSQAGTWLALGGPLPNQ